MPVPAASAALFLCELKGWKPSNLELQKLLYIGQMLNLGEVGAPLVDDGFEAWDYGPVVPDVYRRARAFGSDPVRNVFHWVPPVGEGSIEARHLRQTVELTKRFTPGQLVAITHWPKGAWAKVYRPGVKGIIIPNHLILEEYRERSSDQSS